MLDEQLTLIPESKLKPLLDVDMDIHADGLAAITRIPVPPFGPPIAPLAVAHPPEASSGGSQASCSSSSATSSGGAVTSSSSQSQPGHCP